MPAVIGTGVQGPVRDVDAKIDMGADMSVIPSNIRNSLSLARSGVVGCHGARGERWEGVSTYVMRIRVAGGQWLELDVVESANSYMLIGMDSLQHYVMILDGPAGIFELNG